MVTNGGLSYSKDNLFSVSATYNTTCRAIVQVKYKETIGKAVRVAEMSELVKCTIGP